MITLSQRFAGIIDRRSQHRRQHPRVAVTWPVAVLAGEDSCQGRAENISRGGALIFLNRVLELRESVRLAFEIPDSRTVITATGEVVRTFSLKQGHETPFSHGVGIKFTELTEDDLKFFSGNLAPEWQKDYRELDDAAAARSPNNRIKKSTAIAAAALVCLLAGGYFSPARPESGTGAVPRRRCRCPSDHTRGAGAVIPLGRTNPCENRDGTDCHPGRIGHPQEPDARRFGTDRDAAAG